MDTQLIVRLIVSIIAAVNAVAAMLGYGPLDISEDMIYTSVSVIFMIGTWIWGFWKNNNFTKEAKEAQQVLDIAKEIKYDDSTKDLYD